MLGMETSMNIRQIKDTITKLIDGIEAAIARIEDKENQSEKDETRLAALEELLSAIESASADLDGSWEE